MSRNRKATEKQPKSNRKATEKKTEKPSKPTLSMFFFVFCFLFFGFFGDREMYRKNGRVACKNRAKGWGGSWGGVFSHMRKCEKKFIKCLIFNGLIFFAIFSHPFRKLFAKLTSSKKCVITKPAKRINSLIFNALPTSRKCLIFNGFKHTQGSGRGAWWGFIIVQFLAIGKKLQSHSKATPKTTPKASNLTLSMI